MSSLDTLRNRPAQSNVADPLRETASQTAGPYVHIGCLTNTSGINGIYSEDLTANIQGLSGTKITVKGQVFDGRGDVCTDIMLEFWQAKSAGSFEHGLWHRAATDLETGRYEISTIMPVGFENDDGLTLAPFISVWVVARGINIGLQTRIYFPQDGNLHADDPHLQLIDSDRRSTLICLEIDDQSTYQFDIHLQGENETVFFDT